jgi:hypothetical protein
VDLERVTVPQGNHSKDGTRARALVKFCASVPGILVTVVQGREWPKSDQSSKSVPAVKVTLQDEESRKSHSQELKHRESHSQDLKHHVHAAAPAQASFGDPSPPNQTLQARLSTAREYLTAGFLGDHCKPDFNASFELFLYGSDGIIIYFHTQALTPPRPTLHARTHTRARTHTHTLK